MYTLEGVEQKNARQKVPKNDTPIILFIGWCRC